jgi:hypothetical protein
MVLRAPLLLLLPDDSTLGLIRRTAKVFTREPEAVGSLVVVQFEMTHSTAAPGPLPNTTGQNLMVCVAR